MDENKDYTASFTAFSHLAIVSLRNFSQQQETVLDLMLRSMLDGNRLIIIIF